MGPRTALRDAKIREELGERLRCHCRTAIGMNDEALGIHVFAYEGLREHLLGEYSVLTSFQPPRNDVATKYVKDDIEVVVNPFLRTSEFRNVPAPHLKRGSSGKLGFDTGRMRR